MLGCRGVPAAHGGFETFAEHLALYLADRGWRVTVYCQGDGTIGAPRDRRLIRDAPWRGAIRRIVRVPSGTAGSLLFDLIALLDALRRPGPLLVLGYNTGLFTLVARACGRTIVLNMDGLEWARLKWPAPVRWWLRLNECIAVRVATHLVADHPRIADRVRALAPAAVCTTIPYGAPALPPPDPGDPVLRDMLAAHGLAFAAYALVVCRIEPDNSVLEIVRAFSARQRPFALAIVGGLRSRLYDRAVRDAAGPGVRFLGALYDRAALAALRRGALVYVHGHRVGGTNPSLVEALGAGNAVIAHDNPFNRWTAGAAGLFFAEEAALAALFDRVATDAAWRTSARRAARARHAESFQLAPMLEAYERLLAGRSEPPTSTVRETAELNCTQSNCAL
ncbi:DUF1972 domain-containing protein [Segnochrobactrum spirostomi]|uniref:DUF1972 domain-containing protein n=1 Tax=Segnochrobactrum spirostomi TaxID=2608987 RepID=UPI0028AE78C9|nr:DUF1972 domain-containing protein [Segnochrobactrum spirostomi]